MKKALNKTYETSHAYHTKFGGFIYPSDFNTDRSEKGRCHESEVSNRIAND